MPYLRPNRDVAARLRGAKLTVDGLHLSFGGVAADVVAAMMAEFDPAAQPSIWALAGFHIRTTHLAP